MTSQTAAGRKRLIDDIIDYAKTKLTAKQVELQKTFFRQYFSNVPIEDMMARSKESLYNAISSHWDLIYQRKPKECKIRVFNPTPEEHGWESNRTIIEVIYLDMPFLVDSMRIELNRMGYSIHFVVHLGGMQVRRNDKYQITDILPFENTAENVLIEAPIYIEIEREPDPKKLNEIQNNLKKVLGDVRIAVKDWHAMADKVYEVVDELQKIKPPVEKEDLSESIEYLKWIADDHFTFLGFREYKLVTRGNEKFLEMVKKSGLGVLRDESKSKALRPLSELPPQARKQALSKEILIISKTNTKSTVHRPAYTDYLGVKRFNKKGDLVGEYRFIGLYTKDYLGNPQEIPYLRNKVQTILNLSGVVHHGHAANALMHILETLPRDDLFQGSIQELADIALGIWHLQERRRIKLFVRKDAYCRYVSCMVYLPRDSFNTDLLKNIQKVLMENLNGLQVEYSTYFSESVLARIHFVIRTNPHDTIRINLKSLEAKVIEVGRSWKDSLRLSLIDMHGETKGIEIFDRYKDAFPAGYREDQDTVSASYDINYIEKLRAGRDLGMSFYRPVQAESHVLRFKLFRFDTSIPLSDALPFLENMGLRVIGESPYEISIENRSLWLNDFQMEYPQDKPLDVAIIKQIFHETFYQVWKGAAENDSFNRLVLTAHLSWREISVIRAYTKYLRLAGMPFSQHYIEESICNNPHVARMLMMIFRQRFLPGLGKQRKHQYDEMIARIEKELDKVASLDEDRIIRRFISAINATLRTNFYQQNADGEYKKYISFKIDPKSIPDVPLPIPRFETFVYSPRFEGVHLRGANVARGGIRWSDRREDFRTEVLGLMKAQQVKNAVIVPAGAKGGFVTKLIPQDATREEIVDEGITCYKNFIRGLLDVVDNLVDGKVNTHDDTVKYDAEDPYLVVAADKGTASFSDIANSISAEYEFWLGDAFASGGSVGYDHKKIGITARGAWESVKSHFQEMGLDPQKDEFTIIGIGDMAGDVFGNGLLISDNGRLLAAFNHIHIFIDPNPNTKVAFKERLRLFTKPRSSWSDYDPKLISRGGGVFLRSAKSIKLTKEIKKLFDLTKDVVEPNELIRAILCADVDLLWNGGIGTYVKSAKESNEKVGDRANDALRVNGKDLRCKVIGEGGNLGFTQLGRIEYETHGGKINTDFIDNSAGVDCSDREVNIKILLNNVINDNKMSLKQRNTLLSAMTDEVAELVLYNNYRQARSISYASSQSNEYLELYRQYINAYEEKNMLPRRLEFLPDDKTLHERKVAMRGLYRPEIAVLTAYSKIFIKSEILKSNLPEDPYLFEFFEMAFPPRLRGKYKKQMKAHRLRREIIATQLSNDIVTHMGITFVFQMCNETSESPENVIRSYVVSRLIFDMPSYISGIESLDYKVSTNVQIQLRMDVGRLIRRSTRWFLRNRRGNFEIKDNVNRFSKHIDRLSKNIPELLSGTEKEFYDIQTKTFTSQSVPADAAEKFAKLRALYSVLNIIEGASSRKEDLVYVAQIYYTLMDRLGLIWFREQINAYPVDTHWAILARAAFKGDLDEIQRKLLLGVLKLKLKSQRVDTSIDEWYEKHLKLIDRWQEVLGDIKSASSNEFSMLSVAMRELIDLAELSIGKLGRT